MDSFSIALVLVSTFMHAGWNLLARYRRTEAAFFSKMLISIIIVGFVPTVISETLAHSLNLKAWLCVVGSGSFCGFYYFNLARSYGSSDFTTVYPITRALPVLLVGIGDVLRGRFPTALGWIGMFVIIVGCFFSPLYTFREFKIRSFLNHTSLWMLLTALGTVGYTMLDKIASEIVMQGPATAARYCYIFLTISYIGYTLLSWVFDKKRQLLNNVGWKTPFLGGVMTFGAYWLVLWAYQLSQHASYILAFRQFSIVIGVALAFSIYKEKGLAVRLTGTFMITLGLLIISLWGNS